MIKPSVGRCVLFFNKLSGFETDGPYAALVTHVWSDRMINLAWFDPNGGHHAQTSVTLLQDDDEPGGYSTWAEWMPYQKGQAAKTEALEAKIGAST